MNQGSGLANSVGWQKWNMSKRASSAVLMARTARDHLESCRLASYWSADDLAELERLTIAFEACAARSLSTWEEMSEIRSDQRSTATTDDPETLEVGRDSVLERVQEVYAAGNVTEYWNFVDPFKRLLMRVERSANRQRRNVLDAAARHEATTQRSTPQQHPTADSWRHSADRSALTLEEAEELRRLTSLLSDCASRAHDILDTVDSFLARIDPEGVGSSLWNVPNRLENRMLEIRSDDVVTEALEIERSIATLMTTAAAREAGPIDGA